ncbi:hypothetical protein [Turicibacter sanguinis]|uniref:hypothetical protein n=1 Tax=Turicibacter sanguinis TaxID=154288 RepID=UPI0018A8A04C|nr:hypothetical protein [Turicibacter sanguinis]MDB8553264.1 hypothetical protein [Turicibacter sanguinis]
MTKEQIIAAIIKLKMYKQKHEVIAMKKSQLTLLDSAKIRTSNLSDEVSGNRKDIYDRYENIRAKKDQLKLEIIEDELEIVAIDTALKLMFDNMESESLVITARHVDNKSLKTISNELHLSEATVKRKLNKGEKEFARLLEIVA